MFDPLFQFFKFNIYVMDSILYPRYSKDIKFWEAIFFGKKVEDGFVLRSQKVEMRISMEKFIELFTLFIVFYE